MDEKQVVGVGLVVVGSIVWAAWLSMTGLDEEGVDHDS